MYHVYQCLFAHDIYVSLHEIVIVVHDFIPNCIGFIFNYDAYTGCILIHRNFGLCTAQLETTL